MEGAIDTDPTTGWVVDALPIGPCWGVFQVDPPIGRGPGTRLRVELICGRAGSVGSTLGRFRLSVTNRPFPFFEPALLKVRADGERNGLTRLGAAYSLLGDWAPAEAILTRAAARPDASALDDFLMALAHHHLGRVVERGAIATAPSSGDRTTWPTSQPMMWPSRR